MPAKARHLHLPVEDSRGEEEVRINYGCGKVSLKAIADGWTYEPSLAMFWKNMFGKTVYARLEGSCLVTEDEEMTDTNKYGGISGDPYDAKKAKLVADMMKAKTHFEPISWALAIIKAKAERGEYKAFLTDKPWDVQTPYGDEMRMHLRDRGFKVTYFPDTQTDEAHTKVEW